MPMQAPHLCPVPGCNTVTAASRCARHAVAVEHARPNYEIRQWYRTPRWRALRAQVLREAAYQCAGCRKVTRMLAVDHRVKHGGDPRLFWDLANLQALCGRCHGQKTKRGE
jgi:5-methylcytosine-specific restriction endonuclease McrA